MTKQISCMCVLAFTPSLRLCSFGDSNTFPPFFETDCVSVQCERPDPMNYKILRNFNFVPETFVFNSSMVLYCACTQCSPRFPSSLSPFCRSLSPTPQVLSSTGTPVFHPSFGGLHTGNTHSFITRPVASAGRKTYLPLFQPASLWSQSEFFSTRSLNSYKKRC